MTVEKRAARGQGCQAQALGKPTLNSQLHPQTPYHHGTRKLRRAFLSEVFRQREGRLHRPTGIQSAIFQAETDAVRRIRPTHSCQVTTKYIALYATRPGRPCIASFPRIKSRRRQSPSPGTILKSMSCLPWQVATCPPPARCDPT